MKTLRNLLVAVACFAAGLALSPVESLASYIAGASGGGSGTVTSVTCNSGLTGGTFTVSGTCALDQTFSPTWTGVHTFSANPVNLSGNQSAAAWTTAGIGLKQAAATYTDTTSSGTVANVRVNSWGIPTLAASSAVTFTNAYANWMEPPAQGTNVTDTNAWALGLNGGLNVLTGNIGIASTQSIGVLGNTTLAPTTNTGWQITVQSSAVGEFSAGSGFPDGLELRNSSMLSWANSAQVAASADTGCGRDSAAVIDCGNGSSGTNKSAKLQFTQLNLSNVNVAASAWTTTGIATVQNAATYTDSSTAASGTVTNSYINRWGIPTQAATNASVTYTNDYANWFEPPAAGSNITITNAYAAGFNGNIQLPVDASKIVGNASNDFISFNHNNSFLFQQAGTAIGAIIVSQGGGAVGFSAPAAGGFIWSPTAAPSNTPDTGLTRDSAATVDVGNGTQGSTSGGIKLSFVSMSNLLLSKTAPTISSGFGTSPSIVTQNGTASFQVNVGTGGTATSGVIGLPTASNGWACFVTDITTNSATVFLTKQTAESTTTATLGNFNTSGAAAAWTASDKLNVSCFAR